MGLPKRTKGFRDRADDRRSDLQDDYKESYDTKDDRGFALGSFFDLELVKELGVEIWRPDINEHVIDVIPFYAGANHPVKEEGQLTYKVDFWGHQRIGAMNDFFVCQANTWKVPDPICTWMKANYIEDKKQYNAIKSSRRCAYLIWCHDNKEQEDKGIQIFEVAHFFFEKKVAEIAKKPRSGGFTDWTHYDTGRNVYWSIAKTGSYEDASGTKRDSIEYSGFQLIQRETPKIPDHILEQSFALDELINMRPSDEEVSMAFFGTAKAPPAEKEEEASRLPKKTALERAREAAEKEAEGPADEQTEPPEEATAPEEEVDPPPDDEPKEEPAPVEEKAEVTKTAGRLEPQSDLVCPAAEVGGQFGVTIEQLDECDDCDIWEQCSDANSAGKKATPPPDKKKEEEPKKGGKLVRR